MNNIFNFDKPKTAVQWLVFLAAIGVACASPAGTRAFLRELERYINKKFTNGGRKIHEIGAKELSQALYSLKKRKLIQITPAGAKTQLVLSEKGRKRKFQYDFDKMKISKPDAWDKKWRLIMFDIPEKEKFAREAFRNKLKDLGFLRFQKSVWIYPYPCEKEIDFVTECLRIAPYITFLTVQIDNDSPMRKCFGV